MSLAGDDLLCDLAAAANSRTLSPDSQHKASVVLRIEVATAADTKVATGVLHIFTVLCYAGLLAEIILKATLEDSSVIFRNTALEATNVAVASLCFAFLGGRLVIFLWRVLVTHQAQQCWRPRRRRMACLAFASSMIQMVNIVCWMLPNAYVLRTYPECSFFGYFLLVCGVLRWTCWNSSLLVYLVMGSSLLAWKPGHGLLGKAHTEEDCRLLFEMAIIMGVSPWDTFTASVPMAPVSADQKALGPPDSCPEWAYVVRAHNTCVSGGWALVGTSLLMVCTGAYLLFYCICMIRVNLQLRQQPHTAFRAANILYQLQLRTVLTTFMVLTICTAFLWFFKRSSCLSYFFTWLGMLPMQLIATALAWENLWLFMPKDPESDPALQVWLQESAWAEEHLAQQMAERNSRAEGKQEAVQLKQEPMFCFETALKLLKWSSLTYSGFGQGVPPESDRPHSISETGIVKSSLHAHTTWQVMGSADCVTGNDDDGQQSESSPSMPEESDYNPTLERSSDDSHSVQDSAATNADLPDIVIVGNALEPRQRPKETAAQLLASAMELWGLADVAFFWDPQLDTKALLGWNQDQVVLAFRGTASFANALSDLKIWQTAHHSKDTKRLMPRPHLVHTGFYRAWESTGMHRQVLDHLQGLFSSGAVNKSARVCVTGHSLGGALAVLAAHDIFTELSPASLQVVTFGCPYISNHAYAAEYEACVPDTWHVVHDRDPVVKAGKFWFLFKRPGHRVIINLRGDMLVRPSALELQIKHGNKLRHHWLKAYRAALVSVLLAQFSQRGNPTSMLRALSLSSHIAMREDLAKDGVEWHRLRQMARWAMVAPQKVLPFKACPVGRLVVSRGCPHQIESRAQDTMLSRANIEEAKAIMHAETKTMQHVQDADTLCDSTTPSGRASHNSLRRQQI